MNSGALLLLAATAGAVYLSTRAGQSEPAPLQSPVPKKTILEVLGMETATDALYQPRYFSPDEFGGWFDQLSPVLLRKADKFREAWGGRIVVSPVVGGVGRSLGAHDTSQHNVDRWGEVRALDLFPQVKTLSGEWRYLSTKAELHHAYNIAREVGFTGVGVYTDTAPGYMVHVDVREDREPGSPATWARVAGKYVGVSQAWA